MENFKGDLPFEVGVLNILGKLVKKVLVADIEVLNFKI